MAVIDVPESAHDREVAFWRGATGQQLNRVERYPEYHLGQLHGQEVWLLIQRLGDGAARVHLDIHTDDLAAEVARLEVLGAGKVEKIHEWQVMRDPAGLPFCVVPDPPGTLTDANAQRWD